MNVPAIPKKKPASVNSEHVLDIALLEQADAQFALANALIELGRQMMECAVEMRAAAKRNLISSR